MLQTAACNSENVFFSKSKIVWFSMNEWTIVWILMEIADRFIVLQWKRWRYLCEFNWCDGYVRCDIVNTFANVEYCKMNIWEVCDRWWRSLDLGARFLLRSPSLCWCRMSKLVHWIDLVAFKIHSDHRVIIAFDFIFITNPTELMTTVGPGVVSYTTLWMCNALQTKQQLIHKSSATNIRTSNHFEVTSWQQLHKGKPRNDYFK